MFNASDLKKGLKVEVEGEPYEIVEFDFHKPGKGQALYRCKLKHMLNGNTIDRTFRGADKIAKPDLMEKKLVYSYEDADGYVFIDEKTFDQVTVPSSVLGDKRLFLQPDTSCDILFYKDQPVGVTLPAFVECEVAETEPGEKGDTATNTLKPARLDNGVNINVPLFVNQGDVVKVDTRSGQYRERVRKV